jgi:ribosome maturation factor RimP
MDIIEKVRHLAEPYLARNGMELVEMTYRREQGGMVLRLLVDTPEGVTVDECEALNNFLSETLDRESIIDERYTLEVSSPGLDRPLKTDRDFERAIGREIEVSAYEAVDGRKAHKGTLIGMDRGNIVIESAGVSTVVPKVKIAMARLKINI